MASLVGSIAWPASIAVTVLVLRRQIAALVEGPVKRWKAGPVEVEYWEAKVAAVEHAIVRAEPARSGVGSIELDADIERAVGLADQVPVVAVGNAFALVERRLREIAAQGGEQPPSAMPTLALANALNQRGLITTESESAIRGLTSLRNLAVQDDGRGRSVTPTKAREYVVLVQAVLYALSRPPRT